MLEVVDVAGVATVQDVVGRGRWRRYGVPLGGAADGFSARLANRLLGNADDAAVLEVAGALTVRAGGGADAVAVTGGLSATVDGIPLASDSARRMAPDTRLRLAPGRGMRGYVAVPGGFGVEPVLGSRATDVRTAFGGFEGRALRAGDRLLVAGDPGRVGRLGRWTGARAAGPIRVAPGPHAVPVVVDALVAGAWTVASAADRSGIRLDGSPLDGGGGEVASMGLLPGAIQLPPDGVPIVMLPDGPVTGGYPVPVCVIAADVGRVAQLRPGDAVRFAEVTPNEARDAWRRTNDELAAIEPLDAADDDELAWIGSHG